MTTKRKEPITKKIIKFSMDWHRKLGVVFVLPMLIVGVTSIFMAHDKSLGFEKVMVNAGWLPGYGEDMMKMERQEIKAGLVLPGGEQLVGTKMGLYRFVGGKITPVPGFESRDIKGLAHHDGRIFVGAKMGLWGSSRDGGWEKLYNKEIHSINISHDGRILLATHDEGLMISGDGGKTWSGSPELMKTLESIPVMATAQTGMISLKKLIDDMHTGKAFFGKKLEWIWVDILAVLIIFFTAGGFYFWIWKKQRKAEPRRA